MEFTCGLDDIDTQDLIINEDNIYDYSSFSFILKNTFIESYFSADSMYISSEEISCFIQKITNYENESFGELFANTEYYSVYLMNKFITFSVVNFKEGFSNVHFKIKINNDNIQDFLSIFNKLFDFKKKIEDSYVDLSDIEEYDEEQTDLNQEDDSLLF
jgi:hypothetical protein